MAAPGSHKTRKVLTSKSQETVKLVEFIDGMIPPLKKNVKEKRNGITRAISGV